MGVTPQGKKILTHYSQLLTTTNGYIMGGFEQRPEKVYFSQGELFIWAQIQAGKGFSKLEVSPFERRLV